MNRILMVARVCALVAMTACGEPGRLPPQGSETARDYDSETRLLRTNAENTAMNQARATARNSSPDCGTRRRGSPIWA